MSDEEDSMSEGFSASEEEWIPNEKNARRGRGHDGESSDDDDSDFEVIRKTNSTSAASSTNLTKKKNERKSSNVIKTKTTTIRKRKAAGQTLRTKLYNKYRPPPKTVTSPTSNLPLASTSPSTSTSTSTSKFTTATAKPKAKLTSTTITSDMSKNLQTPNESNINASNPCNEDESSSDSSILERYVSPSDIDLSRSFLNQEAKINKTANEESNASTPVFDCNAGLENLNDSESETEAAITKIKQGKEEGEEDEEQVENEADGVDGTRDGEKYDFSNLLNNLNNIERTAEEMNNWTKWTPASQNKTAHATDVLTMLTLGENLQKKQQQHDDGEDEDDDDDDDDNDNDNNDSKHNQKDKSAVKSKNQSLISKLNKTKSTRVKRHAKVRPESFVAQSDSDDSEWEEVADGDGDNGLECSTKSAQNLEIIVELPMQQCKKNCKTKTQQEMELALKRKFNRERKERQLQMHKASLLCHFAHYYLYNRLLNDMKLMEMALKLLPSQNAYPTEKGTEMKYFQSLANWYKTVITLETTLETATPTKTPSAAAEAAAPASAKATATGATTSINAYKLLYRRRKLCTRRQIHDLLMKQIIEKKAICKQHMIFILIILLRGMGLQCRLIVNLQPIAIKPPPQDLISIQLKPNNNKQKNLNNNNNNDNNSKDTKANVVAKKVTEKKKMVQITGKAIYDTVIKTPKLTKSAKKIRENINNKIKKAQSKLESTTTVTNDITTKTALDKTKRKNVKNKTAKCDTTANNNTSVPKNSADNVQPEAANATTASTTSSTRLTRTKVKDSKNNALSKKSENVLTTVTTVTTVDINVVRQEDSSQPSTSVSCSSSSITVTSPTANLSNLKTKRTHDNQNICIPETTNKLKRTQRHQIQSVDATDDKSKFTLVPNNTNRSTKENSKSKATIAPTIFTLTGRSRMLRSKTVNAKENNTKNKLIPQLDGADDDNDDVSNDDEEMVGANAKQTKRGKQIRAKRPNLVKLKATNCDESKSDEDFEPSPPKKVKTAPTVRRQNNRQVLSPDLDADGDDDNKNLENSLEMKRKRIPHNVWVEVWCDLEEQWICLDLFTTKMHCIESIKKFASPNLAYVYAFQNDLSIKDVTARYCSNWTDTVRKNRVDKNWLDAALNQYMGQKTMRDIKEDQELRRIHEEKPMPTAISDYKNHPFYALERHLLKFEAIYPPNVPTLGYVRNEAVYSRDCVHTLHSRDIWLKQARVVKLGEKPYKIVKARPKWDRLTQTVIKDQPLEIFGYWQTQEYEPPTAENGLVPRNAYGNVELFKPTMLPKKTKHIRLPGLNRICKKLGIDCANAVIGFDFHQGSCHPLYDGFVVCEEFADQVIAAWHQDQEEQERKEQEKWEARVYGNWKKLIRGLLIRERLKLKYNF